MKLKINLNIKLVITNYYTLNKKKTIYSQN